MSSEISKTERALIDAAVAAGRVTQVPKGTSARPYPVWDGRKLVYPDPMAARAEHNAATWRGLKSWNRAQGLEIAKRREEVRALHAGGLCISAMVGRLGVSQQTVRGDLVALGLKPHPAPAPAVPAAVLARKEALRAGAAEGLTADQVAARVGLLPDTVRRIARHMGLVFARPVSAVGRRRARVAELVAQGLDGPAIVARIGVSRSTISEDVRALGLHLPRREPASKRRVRVAGLHAAGQGLAAIAAATDVSCDTIQGDLCALGLMKGQKPGNTALAHDLRLRARVAVLMDRGETRRRICALLDLKKSTACRLMRLVREDRGAEAEVAAQDAGCDGQRMAA